MVTLFQAHWSAACRLDWLPLTGISQQAPAASTRVVNPVPVCLASAITTTPDSRVESLQLSSILAAAF